MNNKYSDTYKNVKLSFKVYSENRIEVTIYPILVFYDLPSLDNDMMRNNWKKSRRFANYCMWASSVSSKSNGNSICKSS